ncbi:hypothetical protein D3C72_1480050 [compost metagenome]
METGRTKKLLQCILRLRIAGGLQQHLLQALAHLRIEIGAHHFHRTREGLGAADHAEVAQVAGRDPMAIAPVHAAHRASVHHALVDQGGDVAFAASEYVAHRVGGGGIARGQQDLRGQPFLQQGHHRDQVGTGGCHVLQGQSVPLEIGQRHDRAVAAHEEHGVVVAHAAALGQQQRLGAAAQAQRHGGTGGLGDPVHPATAQVAGHLLGIGRHQDAAFGDADIAHARDHVVEQGLQLRIV